MENGVLHVLNIDVLDKSRFWTSGPFSHVRLPGKRVHRVAEKRRKKARASRSDGQFVNEDQ